MQNITWYLVFYNTLTPVAGAEPTAFFDTSSTVSGRTGCNDYTGAYKTKPGNKLTLTTANGPLVFTGRPLATPYQ